MINISFFKLNTILILYLRQLKLQSQKKIVKRHDQDFYKEKVFLIDLNDIFRRTLSFS